MALTIIGGKDAHGLKDLGEFMADRIEFDREAVGVSAKTDWHDADSFASIGARFLSFPNGAQVAHDMPSGSNMGTQKLRSTIGHYVEKMRWVVLEYSDACATLGSGQAEAISDFDATEFTTHEALSRISTRMED